MRRKSVKGAALTAMAGCLLQFGGCLATDGLQDRALWDAAIHTGLEYALDSSVPAFELPGDGNEAG